MPRHRIVLPVSLCGVVLSAASAAAQTRPPPEPSAKPPVRLALERVAGKPTQVLHRTDGPVLKERLRLRWPDLTVERIQVRAVSTALTHVRAMRRAIVAKGPRFWGATVLIEQRGAVIMRLRGSRLKVDAAQTRRIRAAVWTGIPAEPHAPSQRHVFVSDPSGSRYYTSSERRTPRRAGRFQARLLHALFERVYVKLARAEHDALVQAPSSVTSLHERGERTLVARRTLYPEVSIERRRVAPEAALTKLQPLEDGLDLPLIRTPSQVRKNEPPGRTAPGLDDQVAPAKE